MEQIREGIEQAKSHVRQDEYQEALEIYTELLDGYAMSAVGKSLLHRDRGVAYLRLNKPEEALVDFNAAVELTPGIADLHALRGTAWDKLDKKPQAAAAYSRALTLSPQKLPWRLERAKLFLDLERYEDAEKDLAKVPSARFENPEAQMLLIRLAIGQDRTEEAMLQLEQVLEDYPEHLELLLLYSHELREQEKFSEALEVANRLISLNPRHPKAKHIQGLCYLELDQNDAAIEVFSTLIEENPSRASYFADRSLGLLRKQEIESALEDVERALSLDPELSIAHYRRGLIYTHKNQYGTALASFNRSIALDDSYPNAYFSRGFLQDKEGFHPAALRDYTSALVLKPEWDLVLCLRGRIYTSKEEFRAAESDFSAALEISPDFAYAWFLMGRLYEKMSDYREAYIHYEQAMELQAGEDAQMSRASIRRRFGDMAGAAEDYLALTGVEDYRFEALVNYAELLLQSGDEQQAFDRISEAVTLDDESVEARWIRAQAGVIVGEFARVLEDTQWLLKQGEPNTDIWTTRGDAFRGSNKNDEALTAYEHALDLFSGNAKAWLGKAYIQQQKDEDVQALESYKIFSSLSPSAPEGYFGQAQLLHKAVLEAVYPDGPDVVTTRAYEDALLERSVRISEILDLYSKAESLGLDKNLLHASRTSFYIEIRRLDDAQQALDDWKAIPDYHAAPHKKLEQRLQAVRAAGRSSS